MPFVIGGWPEGLKAMLAVDVACDAQGLSLRLLELVRLHCSVLNKCDFCIAMHKAKGLNLGVTPRLIEEIILQRDPSDLDEGEQAALAYASVLTMLNKNNEATIAGATWALRQHFRSKDVIILTYVVGQINAWNRLARADHAST